MRSIQDIYGVTNATRSIHFNNYSKKDWMNKISEDQALIFRKSQQWRYNLQQGDYIDAINYFATPHSQQSKQLSGWSPAKIVGIDDITDQLLVSFLRCNKNDIRKISRFSDEIAQQGTYTDDWSWRFDLKEDDVFDCLDDYGTWYRSTVLQTDEADVLDVDGNSVPLIKIGYRYVDPSGTKDDHKGRKCIGFTLPKFDSINYVALPNIQPLNTLTTQYFNVGTGYMEYDLKVQDQLDWVYPSKTIHQWANGRDNEFSGFQFFADLLNEFGQIGGFDIIRELYIKIAEARFKTSLEHVISLQNFLKNTLPLWTRQFSCKYCHEISLYFGQILQSEDTISVLSQTPDKLQLLLTIFSDLQKRVNTRLKINQNQTSICIQLGANLLKSDKFQKRLQGICIIAEKVKSARRGDDSKERMIKELVKFDIFSLVFSAQRFHLQIAKRSEDIIKLYISERQFDQYHIDMLWESTFVDETALIEVYRIIQETSSVMLDEKIECFIKKISECMEPSKVTQREVEFLHSVGKGAFYKSQARQSALNALWEIFMSEKPGYQLSLAKQSRKNYCDLLRNAESEIKEDFINKAIVSIIEKRGNSIQAIKVFKNIISLYPKYVSQYYSQMSNSFTKTQSNLIQTINQNQNIIHVILDDLQSYLNGHLRDEGMSHTKSVAYRLKAIKFVLETVEDKKILTAGHVQRVWKILYADSKEDSDAALLFDWFSQVLSNQTWCKEHPDIICYLFQTYMINNVQKLFQQGANQNGFQCIQTLFIYVNEKENNLNVLSRESAVSSAAGGSVRTKLNCKFKVNVLPGEMIGLDLIWQFFDVVCLKRDNELQTSVINFLSQVYLSQGQINKHKNNEIYQEFTKQCFTRFDRVISQQNQLESAATYEIVKNTTQMLLTFFEDCEKKGGTAMIRPHNSIDEKVYEIQNLVFVSYIYVLDQPKYIVLNAPSNMTVWEVIDYLAKQMNKSPLKLLLRRDSSKPDITPADYCKSLGQLKFENNEEITINKTSISYLQVPLINPLTGHLVKEVEVIFSKMFEKFSIPASEIPNLDLSVSTKADRYMTKQCAVDFLQNALISSTAQRTRGIEQIQPDDKRIKTLFQENDTDRDDLLTIHDFLRFYRISSTAKPEVVWGNLQAFGYNNDLTQDPKGEQTYDSDPNITVDEKNLPRSYISENSEYLQKLFSIQTEDTRTQEQVWKLIKSLKTNTAVYNQILDSQNLEQLFNPQQPILKLQYYLQIANYLLTQETSQIIKPVAKLYSTAKAVVAGGDNYQKEFPSLDSAQQIDTTSNIKVQPLETIEEEPQTASEIQFKNMGADSHWERPKVVSSSTVIALPAAAPQDQQGESPASQKQSYNQIQLSQWKGTIKIDENPFPKYYSPLGSQHDIWLVEFLTKKGFQALVRLLQHFVSSNTPSSKAQTNCLKQITHTIKIILTVTLSACNQNSDQVTQLVRKMSSSDQAQTNSQNLQAQSYAQTQYGPIIEQLRIYGVSHTQLLDDDPNLSQIQQILKATFQFILKNQQSNSEEERQIVADCLDILVNQLTFNASYLQTIYSDPIYAELLIDRGLLSESFAMRSQFKESIEFICRNIKVIDDTPTPARFFLGVLKAKLSQICHSAHSRTTEHYFALLKELMQQYYTYRMLLPDPNIEENTKPFIISALEQLNTYQVNEGKSATGLPDNTLVGLLQLITIMLKNEPKNILSEQEKALVLAFLVQDCLFNKPQQDVQIHITQNVDVRSLSTGSLNKCHSHQSREAAYDLFQTLIGDNHNQQLVQELVGNFWAPIIMKLEKPTNSNSLLPSERTRSSLGFAGLKNLGSICYMNSMIQQFYHVPAFRYCLLAADDQVPQNLQVNQNGKKVDDNNLHQWMRLFGFLELTDRQDYNPEDFTYSFKQPGGQLLDVRVQQDAQEFLGNAFDKLENSLKDTPMKYLCQSVFQGQSTNLTICKNCNNINQTDEEFYALPCSVKDQNNLETSLRNLVGGETISDYRCDACKQKVSIEKQFAIKKLPNTLILHLKRLDFDFNTMKNVKLNDRLEFPNVLNMRNYMLSEVIKDIKKKQKPQKQAEPDQLQIQEEDAKQEEEDVQVQVQESIQKEETVALEEVALINDEEFEYKLVGVVVHMGGADAGHYISLINVERESDPSVDPQQWMKTERQTWLEFNDSQVKPFDFSQLGSKCYGEQVYRSSNIISSSNYIDENSTSSQNQTNAYMLFYEKRIKTDLSFVVDERIIQQIRQESSVPLVCDGTAIPRALQQIHCCYVYPQLAQRILTEQIEPNTRINVPFYEIQKFVPNYIYRQISLDNQIFMAEKQVYDANFFETTNMLLQKMLSTSQNFETINEIYTMVDKLLFDILFNSSYSKPLEKLCAILLQVVNQSPVLVARLLQERILKYEKPAGSLLDQPFFEELIFNRSQEVREMIEYILTKVTGLFNEKLKNYQELSEEQISQLQQGHESLIQSSFSYLNKSDGFNGQAIPWHKLGAYLNFFYNSLKTRGWPTVLILKRENIVRKLVELVSKYKDNMVNQHYNPPLENAIRTISLLVRAQPLVIYLYGIPPDQQVSIEEYEEVINQGGPSVYYEPIDGCQLYLSAQDIKSLFMADKKSKSFWEISFQFSGLNEARDELCKLMQHVCYQNYDISKRIAKILIQGLNLTQADAIKPYAIYMEHFLTIPDQFQQARIEWIFGLQNISMTKPHNQMYVNNNSPEIHKIGVNNINDVSDMIFDYQSPLLKVQNNTTETLAQILYKYRKGGFQDVVLVLLEHVTKAILNDKTVAILEFLLKQDGPAYTCKRYWDWFLPYITQFITDSYSGVATSSFSQEISFRILANIELINQTHKQTIESLNVREPYIVWKIDSQSEYRTIKNEYKDFHVVLTEYNTVISASNPNPAQQINENIEKVTKSWTTSWQFVKSKSQHDQHMKAEKYDPEISPIIKKQYGRGNRGKTSTKDKVYRNKQVGQELHYEYINDDDPQNNQDNYSSEEGDDENNLAAAEPQKKISNKETAPQQSFNINMQQSRYNNSNEGDRDSFSDNRFYPEEAIQQDIDQAVIEDLGAKNNDGENIFNLSKGNPNEEHQEDPFYLDDDKGADAAGVANFGQGYQSAEDLKQNLGNEEMKSELKSESDTQEKTKYQANAIMQIILRNFNRYKVQNCTMIFDQNPNANYYVPKSEINCSVSTTTDQTFIRLMKYRPNEPWGSISFKFLVDKEDSQGIKKNYDNNWPQLRASRSFQQPLNYQLISEPEPPQDPIEPSGVNSDEISCSICTFLNPLSATSCEMCSSPLG